MSRHEIVVVGAGMVGVCCALELQRRGFAVTLVDRREPGCETSYGNAGVISRSSIVPYNNPGLWAKLPVLLRNQSAQFRYRPGYLVRNAAWALGYLMNARRSVFEQTTAALDSLIQLSDPLHRCLMRDAGVAHRMRNDGWLILFRSDGAFQASALTRATYEKFGVAAEVLDQKQLRALEPSLSPIFTHALWMREACTVDSPGHVVRAYASMFVTRGGVLRRMQVKSLQARGDGKWQIGDGVGTVVRAPRLVVALGPWSAEFLRIVGIRVPMGFERGYHMHYGARDGAVLHRPIFDTGGSYVLCPMEQGLRLATGVELDDCDAPASGAQLPLAERAARQAFPLAQRLEDEIWMGRRPTLPDTRPIIGEASRHAGLWLAFGHHHIGFGTGPGTASVLGSLICGERPAIDPTPFRPDRYLA